MKEEGFDHWLSPNTDATNSSGFTALPAGYRDAFDGSFYPLGNFGQWWSTDVIYGVWFTSWENGWLQKTDYLKEEGHSVRCIKD